MTLRRGVVILVSAALVPAAISGAHAKRVDPEPFLVHADSLTGRYGVIAVSHVVSLGSTRIPSKDKTTRFAEGIRERLGAAGFELVSPDSVLAGWGGAVQAVGGIFDARSGRRDTSRHRLAEENTERWLRDSLGVELWLRYEVVEVGAEYDHGTAQWDGVKMDVGAPGFVSTILLGLREGMVPVLSLQLSIHDLEGRALYLRRAGLQPRNHMVKDQWVPVPLENLREEELMRRALDRALGPWIARVAPRQAPSAKATAD